MKRTAALLLAMLMTAAMLAGCQPGDAQQTPTTGSTASTATDVPPKPDDGGTGLEMSDVPGMTAPGVLPIVIKPMKQVTLTFAFVPNSMVTDYKDNDWTKWLEEQTGVNIEFFPLPTTNAAQKIELMVASGQELPDILCTGLSDVTADTFYQDGIILPLDEMMDKYCYWWNEMMDKWVMPDDAELMHMYSRTYDGTRIKFPVSYVDPSSTYSPTQTVWLREDWLKAVGKEIPTTTEELYDVLVAFRDGDPNGNKKKDEIPFVATPAVTPSAGGTTGANAGIDAILSSFAYSFFVPTRTYMNAKDGQLYISAATEEYREGLRYVNRLVSEGLMSTLSFTADATQIKSMFNLEGATTPYAGGFMAHPTSFITDEEQRADYVPVFPLYGPEGKSYACYSPNVSFQRVVITKYCKNPEVAVRLLDYFCEEETMLRSRWGVKDRDWNYVTDPNVKPRYENLGFGVVYECTNNPYAGSNNIIWKVNALCPLPAKLFGSRPAVVRTDESDKVWASVLNGIELDAAKREHAPDEFVPNLMYTAVEANAISEIRTSLFSYIMECQTAFAIGEMSVDKDWDAYLKTLEDIGMKDFLTVSQAAYDRMTK